MKKLTAWLMDRADEPSTWRGLFFIGSALGFLTLDPEKATILAAGLAMVFGGADVIAPDPIRKLRPRVADNSGVRDAATMPTAPERAPGQASGDRSGADKSRDVWLGD
jgi:hypothetical protein